MGRKNGKPKITDPTRILTVANVISLGRAILAVPIIYSLQNPELWWITLGLILLAVISDILDGFFARRAHEVTHIGKWLDPIADFILIISVSFYLVLFDLFPFWFFMVYLVRYILIALPAIYLINNGDFVLSANRAGKWAVGISTLTIVLHIFRMTPLDGLRVPSLWVALVLLILSGWSYFRTYRDEFKKL